MYKRRKKRNRDTVAGAVVVTVLSTILLSAAAHGQTEGYQVRWRDRRGPRVVGYEVGVDRTPRARWMLTPTPGVPAVTPLPPRTPGESMFEQVLRITPTRALSFQCARLARRREMSPTGPPR